MPKETHPARSPRWGERVYMVASPRAVNSNRASRIAFRLTALAAPPATSLSELTYPQIFLQKEQNKNAQQGPSRRFQGRRTG